ncbi:glycosyltransferase family 2 protein [Candidatus Pacearchaeota archaeon]|nr:glycosyltransferase family 2 protein [Candidatus Pacearchaeota archaeon]
MENKIKYSVVVPVYNEEGNVARLNLEIKGTMNSLGKSYEIIYVNDGSTDRTLGELKSLKKIKIIDLNKNYGQATALDAGFKESQGKIVISMDGDLQNDPADIPKLLDKLDKENLDVVCGWRKHRKDKVGIKMLTLVGRFLRGVIIRDDVHDTGCTLRVYRKEAVKSLDISGEMHRYILAILRWKGFKVGEVVVNHRARTNGVTKYGYNKALKGFIDLLYIWFLDKYSQRPLHVFGGIGLASFGVGTLIEIVLVVFAVFKSIDLSANAWFPLGFYLMIAGLTAFSFGVVIDLLMKIHLNNSPYEKRYYVREVVLR